MRTHKLIKDALENDVSDLDRCVQLDAILLIMNEYSSIMRDGARRRHQVRAFLGRPLGRRRDPRVWWNGGVGWGEQGTGGKWGLG